MLSAPRLLATVLTLVAAIFSLTVASAAADTYRPSLFSDPIGGGTECAPPEAPPSCSLRGAIAVAKAGDTIELKAGTYSLSFGSLKPSKLLNIVGAGPGLTTIQQSAAGGAVIEVKEQAGIKLTGLTITGGHLVGKAGADGAAAGENGKEGGSVAGAGLTAGGPTTLTDVRVTGNLGVGGDGGNGGNGSGAGSGGEGGRGGTVSGVGISGGNPLTLTRVAVTDNVAKPGAGGNGGNGGATGNGGVGGKGGYSSGAVSNGAITVTVRDSTISGNVAETGAGGDGGKGGTTSGTGGKGGQGEASTTGGFFSNGDVQMTNVTISGNVSYGGTGGKGGAGSAAGAAGGQGGITFGGAGGGASLFNGAEGVFAATTIAGNTVTAGSPGAGGAAGPGGTPGAAGTASGGRGANVFVTTAALSLRNSILALGTGPAGAEDCTTSGSGTITSLGRNLIDRSGQCFLVSGTGDLLGVPSGLGPLADNGGATATRALLPGSAAIDAAGFPCLDAAGSALATDQRGLPRGNPCDIGAFEVQPPPPPAPPPPPTDPAEPAKPAPVLSALKISPTAAAPGDRVKISFALDRAATVKFTLQRKLGKKWGKPGAPGPKGFRRAFAGTHKRFWKLPALKPGTYRLRATPAGGKPKHARLSVRAPAPVEPFSARAAAKTKRCEGIGDTVTKLRAKGIGCDDARTLSAKWAETVVGGNGGSTTRIDDFQCKRSNPPGPGVSVRCAKNNGAVTVTFRFRNP